MRQGRARHLRNRAQSSALRTALKRVRTATTSEQAGEAYRVAARLLDRAARKNLIHSNNAAGHKSMLAAVVEKLVKQYTVPRAVFWISECVGLTGAPPARPR